MLSASEMPPLDMTSDDLDALNEQIYVENRNKLPDEVLSEFDQSYNEAVRAAGLASVTRRGQEIRGNGGPGFVKRGKTGLVRDYNQKCQPGENGVHCTQPEPRRRRLADAVYHRMGKTPSGVG